MKRMKVVHLSLGHDAEDTRILQKECKSLASAGHDVTLVAQHHTDKVVDGVQIRAVGHPKNHWQRWTRCLWRVFRYSQLLHADLYHFHDPELIPLGIWLSFQGKRVIYDAHEDLPKTFAYKYYIPAFARKTLGWLAGQFEHLAVRRFAAVVAATPSIAKRFAAHNPNTVVVRNFPKLGELPNGANLAWDHRPPLVVYVGSISPERGFREAIRAISLLPAELNARLAFAGPVSSTVRDEILRLPGADRCDFLGALTRNGVAALLGRARVGLVSLHRMPNFLTALPVKLFEYMSAGVPVIASDFPLWRQIVEDSGCGLLIDPQDIAGIARGIEYLLTNAEEAKTLGASGRRAVEERYNWKTEEDQLLKLYRSPCCQPYAATPKIGSLISLKGRPRSFDSCHISNGARVWAVKELARRAGVEREWFQSWRIEVWPSCTTIYLEPGTSKRIAFKHSFSSSFPTDLLSSNSNVGRRLWMRTPEEPIRRLIPDLIVPYCDQSENGSAPLFQATDRDRVDCAADLPALTLLTLTRAEESQPSRLDIHGRFPANYSLAFRQGFFDRPIVDEWGLAFAQAIQQLVPRWRPKERRLRAKISHDIDDVGLPPHLWRDDHGANSLWHFRTAWMAFPFDLRHAVRVTVKQHAPAQAATQIARTISAKQPTCLQLIDRAVLLAKSRGLDTAVYWKASRLGPFDSGYDPRNSKIREAIRSLQERNVENGVHPGYATYRCAPELQREVELVRGVIGERSIGGRQHYLRWCPETWADWENLGLAYDSTLGYIEQAGFRAGTCIPYRPWLVGADREAHLLEIPLVMMDVTVLEPMTLPEHELLLMASQLIAKCTAVGGVFTLLFHNTTLRDARSVRIYEGILDLLTSSSRFDWQSSLNNEWN